MVDRQLETLICALDVVVEKHNPSYHFAIAHEIISAGSGVAIIDPTNGKADLNDPVVWRPPLPTFYNGLVLIRPYNLGLGKASTGLYNPIDHCNSFLAKVMLEIPMSNDFTELLQSIATSLRLSDLNTCDHICNQVATALDKPVRSAGLVRDLPASMPQTSPDMHSLEGIDTHADLFQNIRKINSKLTWRQPGFGRIPSTITKHLAVCEIIGPDGQIPHREIRAGLLYQAADVTYPSHNHAAEEVYLTLTGPQEWQKDNDAWYEGASGDFIHHLPYQPHAIRTAMTPLLALWVWTGNIDGGTYRI